MAQIVTITNPLTGQPAQVDQLEHTAQEIDDATTRALAGGALDQNIAKKMDATESADYSGCYYRMVDGVQEWINPPMVVDVEYRTTERYNGKPVYTKIISFGNFPNNTTKDIIWSESGIVSDVIHASVTTSNGSLIGGAALSGAEFTATRTNIYIKTTGDYSSMTAEFLLKYTKMTD